MNHATSSTTASPTGRWAVFVVVALAVVAGYALRASFQRVPRKLFPHGSVQLVRLAR
jgi:hypothetical protein